MVNFLQLSLDSSSIPGIILLMEQEMRHRKSVLAVNLGLIANIFLAGLKTIAGIFGHSPALLADGINSTSDVAYYVVVAIFMRLARKPADDEHPYGHSQLESIASLVVGAFVVATAVAIFWDAVNNVFELLVEKIYSIGAAPATLWIAVFTVALKVFLALYTQGIGQQTGNAAVLALAYDHRNDIFSASSAAIGIFMGRMGYPWADPLVGALVALLVLRTGVQILRQSSADLMDDVPSRALGEKITGLLAEVPGVECVEELHAHRFGPYLVINITIAVDGDLSVTEGDRIACQVEEAIYAKVELVRRVYVHYHPVQSSINQSPGESRLPNLACDLGRPIYEPESLETHI